MPKRKSFIDKKNSVAFRLLHRSQKDPLIAADDRGLVLAPVHGVEKLSIQEEGPSGSQPSTFDPSLKKLNERVKFGIYFDDDYDYLQHLKNANEVYALDGLIEKRFRINKDGTTVEAGKDIVLAQGEKSKLELPSTLFESKGVELRTGLLNQAAPLPGPHPELDPDIVAALDDENYDFDSPENLLEDDFIAKANAPSTPSSDESKMDNFARPRDVDQSDFEDEDDDQSDYEDETEGHGFDANNHGLAQAVKYARDRFAAVDAEDETRSRFTSYSLTSSVMRRSDGLKHVDAVFEKLYEQYDDDELGELVNEDDEIVGFIKPESQRVQQMVEEYENDLLKEKLTTQEVLNDKDATTRPTLKSDEESDELEDLCVEDKLKEKWDCESFLSTHSTLYNHPTVISEPRRKRCKVLEFDPKTGLPLGVLRQNNLGPVLAKLAGHVTDDTMDVDEGTNRTRASTVRSRFETTEQRRVRKGQIKVERKERRKEKKTNKSAFRIEGLRVKKQDLNMKQNLSGIRLV